jgi:hypothetical protein
MHQQALHCTWNIVCTYVKRRSSVYLTNSRKGLKTFSGYFFAGNLFCAVWDEIATLPSSPSLPLLVYLGSNRISINGDFTRFVKFLIWHHWVKYQYLTVLPLIVLNDSIFRFSRWWLQWLDYL